MSRIWLQLKKWACEESGVASIEYALISVLIAVVIVSAVTYVGDELRDTYEYIAQCVQDWSCE